MNFKELLLLKIILKLLLLTFGIVESMNLIKPQKLLFNASALILSR